MIANKFTDKLSFYLLFYGCETWFSEVSDYGLENRIPRRIFVSKRKTITKISKNSDLFHDFHVFLSTHLIKVIKLRIRTASM